MKILKKVIVRTIAGDTMLVPIGETIEEYNGLFTLSPSAAFIFDCIQQGMEEPEILKSILNEFEVDEDTARNDMTDFISALREYGIVG